MLHILADDFSPFPFEEEIRARIAEGKESILLVPEHLALATEKALASRYPACAPLFFEVSNFSRLCDRVFRKYGGISYQYADAASDIILMWKTLDALSPMLRSPKRGAADTVKETLSLFSEITAAGIRAQTLKKAAGHLSEESSLGAKLSDLALITETFTGERDHIYGSLSHDLDKLLAILEKEPVFHAEGDMTEEPLFRDTAFFVSGFTSFTAGEAAILAVLMRKSELSVSLPLPEEGESSLAYEEVLATRDLLLSLKESSTPLSQAEIKTADRPPMLAHAKRMLFRKDGSTPAYEGKYDEALTLVRSKDVYSAAAHVAARIAADVRAGARYRDFTVIARNPEKYDGILDEALLSEGIPVFFAKKTSMTEFALIKMILSAYACLDRGFARADLIGYMKCGFSGLSHEDADLFELYTEVWRLKGSALASDAPLQMYPDGYKTRPSEEDIAALARINEVRRTLLSPLLQLKKDTETITSATEHAAALYRFLRALGAEDKLAADAREETARGRHTEAARLLRLFPLLCDLLDRIVTVLENTPLTRARFSELLSLLFSATPVSTVPTVMDAVTVADADTFRRSEEHTLFLFGAIEGEFPASVGLDGVFSEKEREQLATLDISVGKPPEVRASREQFSFLRGIAAAEHTVVLAFDADAMGAAVRPSNVFLRLTKLFPKLAVVTGDADVFSLRAAKERFHDMLGSAKEDALRPLLFGETEEDGDTLYTTPLFDPDCFVSEATASKLFEKDMDTSQSAIDHFLDCPFAYYCKHALSLNANEAAAIRPVEVGNIVHEILECFFRYLKEDRTDIKRMDPSRIPAYVERAVTDYAARLFPREVTLSARISHLMYRLRRAAILVCSDLYEEFSVSAFTPAFCELKLESENGPGKLTFRDESGKTVSFGGRIDRVDTYLSEEGKLFVRVVDYKSSEHKFSREDLKKARNLQMFIYLCAIWKTENKAFKKRLSGSEDREILPAGIVYSTANPTPPSFATLAGEEEMKTTLAKKNLRRRGFFLSEEAVLRAMDDHLPHMSYAADKKNNYNTKDKKQFASVIEFGEMYDDVEAAVLQTARRMRAGEACIAPDKKTNRCPDCPFRPLCRIEGVKKKNF